MSADLHGLVLCGGRSTRMGRDKAALVYHAAPQWRHVADLLTPHCREVFWSCRPEQRDAWQLGDRALTDAGIDGPGAGLATAFERALATPVPWLVLACDYPWLAAEDVALLVAARDPRVEATAFEGPEPLLAIWEPGAQRRLLAAPGASPRRILLEGPLRLVAAPLPQRLTNVNYGGNAGPPSGK